ncbi:hypothetical protein [Pseudoruegeria sp. SK021]|uniref:hypothetical protein n=1 Tax=Pseudoruegeria sp. SK021 TaxID=1933035 RepID=UPI000A25EC50|nr:hypothetical protein [Pseudoruegeria sp. SK021]OSP54694.1 hypothetical protein BV911_11050 [Pseudoruegeria sp. SK021]
MQTQISKPGSHFLTGKLPIGYFLTGKEEDNLKCLFDAPELLRQAAGPPRSRKRQFAIRPLIVMGLVMLGVLAGIWHGIDGI